MARKRYTKEFKQQAVQLVLNRSPHADGRGPGAWDSPGNDVRLAASGRAHRVISNEPNFKTDDPAALKLQLRDLQKASGACRDGA